MPSTFLKNSKVSPKNSPNCSIPVLKEVGIFLTLGDKGTPGNLKFVADFGTSFAKQGISFLSLICAKNDAGHIVVRQFAKTDDAKRQQEVKKTVNACVASPYAKHVRKWVLVGLFMHVISAFKFFILGVGPGCQVASIISNQFEESLKALVFVASPLTFKDITEPDGSLKVPYGAGHVPILFLHPSITKVCSKEVILERLATDSYEWIRFMSIPDVDQNFRTSKGKNAVHVVSTFAVSAVFEFLNVLESGDLKNCLIPSLEQISTSQANDKGEDSMNIDDQALSL